MSIIRTANQMASVQRRGGYREWVTFSTVQQWKHLPKWTVAGDGVKAYVIRSMWVGDCPDCANTMIVEPGDLFYCTHCCNAVNDSMARPLDMPDQAAEIEAILMRRPIPDNRNWLPDETVDDLIMENREHGLDDS